jgi:phage terminase large subunit-like protein
MSQIESQIDEYFSLLQAIQADVAGNQIDRFYRTPEDRDAYCEHLAIFKAGATFRERLASGGNRTGKSTLGAVEVSYHLTGLYPPDWWEGHKFTRPTRIWACGVTREAVRSVCQEKLLGPPHSTGTGMIPREAIIKKTPRAGLPDSVDTVTVKHVSGGTSTLSFRTYAEGREPYQGTQMSLIWLDELPPMAIYSECLMRLMATDPTMEAGRMLVTATPMRSFSEVIGRFLVDGALAVVEDRYSNYLTWDHAPHLSDDEKKEYMKTIPKSELAARTRGEPIMGAAGIYEFEPDEFIVKPFEIPVWWLRGYGMDVGWRATAAVWIAMNPDTGEHFIYSEYKQGETRPIEHAGVIRARSKWLTGAIDPASNMSGQKDGVRLLEEYRDLGLRLVKADNAVGAGLDKVRMLIATDKLKIFSTCNKTLAEMRQYSYLENGKPRKVNDHLMDSMRYIVMTPKAMRRPMPYIKPKVNRAMK